MFSRTAASALAAFTALAVGPAFADPAYRASDIVSHFAPATDLGAPRSLCIGTESECAKSIAPKAKVGGFDLVVKFEYNSDRLTKSAQSNLDEFARALGDPRLSASGFVVEGHTDGKGSEEFNLDLSTRRAQSVVTYLGGRGVPASRLEAKGYGKQKLLAGDPLAESNRRVETRLRAE